MTKNSPPSGFDDPQPNAGGRRSNAFDLLHEKVQRWIWAKGWQELRDAQERAIEPILEGKQDVIIAAATAAGKTEAAFLPICSRLAGEDTESVAALYVSPLKALINDQYRRLAGLCAGLDIPVHRWHGDVPADRKRKVIEKPSGILLITPESLEAIFVNQGNRAGGVFRELRYVVLDELHAYIGTERGRHVQSLLHRLELLNKVRIPRIGLSATLGDMFLAARFLRLGNPERVLLIESSAQGQGIRLQIRGYQSRDPVPAEAQDSPPDRAETGGQEPSSFHAIGNHLYKVLRGSSHLVFANSRREVELYADYLRQSSEKAKVPNEFFPHHGNLSKEIREHLELRLKEGTRPTTAVCTSTLELGIDIGQVTSIAQIGSPFSVSSLRQRLGRSGRRGDPAILRLYIDEPALTASSSVLDRLRTDLVQAIAMTELLIERWCEPPEIGALHLSTLVHQTLSLIAQYGGITPKGVWNALCGNGPFGVVRKEQFILILRCMGERDLVTQAPDGVLLLGGVGERIVNHFTFYAVFQTPEEYRIIHSGRTLGTVAFDRSLVEGMYLIFAGRRWRIVSVRADDKTVVVEPSPAGRVPKFAPSWGGLVDDRVRLRMRQVYESGDLPAYLNEEARKLLVEARTSYVDLGLQEKVLTQCGNGTLFFLCRGDRILNTILVQLKARGCSVAFSGPALTLFETDPTTVWRILENLADAGEADSLELAGTVLNKASEKFDWALDDTLLSADYATKALDAVAALAAIKAVVAPQ